MMQPTYRVYTASDGRLTNKCLEKDSEGWSSSLLGYYPCIYLEGLRKVMKKTYVYIITVPAKNQIRLLGERRWEGRPWSHFRKPIASVCHVTPHCERALTLHECFFNSCFVLSVIDDKIEQHVCAKFCVKLCKSTTGTLQMLCETFEEHPLSWIAVSRSVECHLNMTNVHGDQAPAKTQKMLTTLWTRPWRPSLNNSWACTQCWDDPHSAKFVPKLL
jgi:hypothetical protein